MLSEEGKRFARGAADGWAAAQVAAGEDPETAAASAPMRRTCSTPGRAADPPGDDALRSGAVDCSNGNLKARSHRRAPGL